MKMRGMRSVSAWKSCVLASLCSVALIGEPVAAMSPVGTPLAGIESDLLHLVNETTTVTPKITATIVAQIKSVTAECRRYDAAYRVDCLAQGLKQVASRLPAGDYGAARSILSRASSKLSSLVSKNLDSAAPPLKAAPGANPNFKSSRTYRAVKKAAIAAVSKEANKIIAEAVTELMRAYDNSDKRQAHYQKIATAVDGTKVLLRS